MNCVSALCRVEIEPDSRFCTACGVAQLASPDLLALRVEAARAATVPSAAAAKTSITDGWTWRMSDAAGEYKRLLVGRVLRKGARGGIEGLAQDIARVERIVALEGCVPASFTIAVDLGAAYSDGAMMHAKTPRLAHEYSEKASQAWTVAAAFVRGGQPTGTIAGDNNTVRSVYMASYWQIPCELVFSRFLASECRDRDALLELRPFWEKAVAHDPEEATLKVMGKYLAAAQTDTAEEETLPLSGREPRPVKLRRRANKDFKFIRDFSLIRWKATAQVNLIRAALAAPVWGLVALFSGEPKLFFVYTLLFVVMYVVVFVPISIAASWLMSLRVPFVGWVWLVLSLLVAVGDPFTAILARKRPDLVPIEDFRFFDFSPIIFVLDDEEPS
jgi:hypothetical protein